MTSPVPPPSVRPVDYKGEPLDAERGPGLGCFRFQLAVLVVLVILTPLTVAWNWNPAISIAMLLVTLVLLLFAGQTVIFLLRLVAADRREGVRHAPRAAAASRTVGQLEDAVHVDALGRPIDGNAHPAAPSPADQAGTAHPAGAPDDHAPAGTNAPVGDQPAGPGMRE